MRHMICMHCIQYRIHCHCCCTYSHYFVSGELRIENFVQKARVREWRSQNLSLGLYVWEALWSPTVVTLQFTTGFGYEGRWLSLWPVFGALNYFLLMTSPLFMQTSEMLSFLSPPFSYFLRHVSILGVLSPPLLLFQISIIKGKRQIGTKAPD